MCGEVHFPSELSAKTEIDVVQEHHQLQLCITMIFKKTQKLGRNKKDNKYIRNKDVRHYRSKSDSENDFRNPKMT